MLQRRFDALKKAKSLVPVPILAVTAFVSDQDRAECYAAGMTGFLGKPVTQNVLLDTMLKVFLRDAK